jgi:class 3 adenylate cyclase
VRQRTSTYATWFGGLLWVVAGLGMLALQARTAATPTADTIIVVAGCAALALAFGALRHEFRNRSARLITAPDAGFLVLVAVAVPPAWAMVAGLVVGIGTARRLVTWPERVFTIASAVLATGIGAIAAHDAFGSDVDGRAVLGAVVIAAIARSFLSLVAQLLLAESRAPGGARAILRDMPLGSIFALEAGLPIATVAVAGPFLDEPPLALLVVLAGQLLTWRVFSILHGQFNGRHVNTELLDTFQRFVPQHVADAILETPGANASVEIGAERRELTVMFVDIRGFTSWSERTDAAEVLRELNVLLGDLADAILATDGTIDKFTGDGLMAFWNAPSDQPDHATRAVQAIPKLLMRVREFNIRREVQHEVALEIGIGIATGPAMVGNIGHRDRLAFTAIGDTVNLAARLEKATATQGVGALVDERTFLGLPTQVQRQFMRLDSIEVKGRSERVRLYAPVALVRHRDRDAVA